MSLLAALVLVLMNLSLASRSYAESKEITFVTTGSATSESGRRANELATMFKKVVPGISIKIDYMGAVARDGVNDRIRALPKDGTHLFLGLSTVLISDELFKELQSENAHIVDSLDVIDFIGNDAVICVTSMQSPYRDYRVFFKTLKETPQKLRHAIFGKPNTLYSAYFSKLSGADYSRVTKLVVDSTNSKPIFERILADEADYFCSSIGYLRPLLERKVVAPIFSNSIRTVDEFGGIPNARQIGLKGLERFPFWHVLAVPKGTPNSVILNYRKLLKEISADPTWQNNPNFRYGSSMIGKITDPNRFFYEEKLFFQSIILGSRYYASN